jgi:hypothetical protein
MMMPGHPDELQTIRLLGEPSWAGQGPSPILVGDYSIAGAVQVVVGTALKQADRGGRYVLYAGTINGGVWRADNFTDTMLAWGSPRLPAIEWRPLTDQQPSLSVSSLALDPLDRSGQTLWVGTGQLSSGGRGGPPIGLLRTANGTDPSPTWSVRGDETMRRTDVSLTGLRIIAVAPASLVDDVTGQQIVLVASFDGQGILRSRDAGRTFQRVGGPVGPRGGFCTDLVADPNDPMTFFAALRATYDDRHNLVSSGGIMRSQDGGLNWVRVDKGIPQASRSQSLKLAIFNNRLGTVPNAGPTILYVGQADASGRSTNLIGIFRSTDPGSARPRWTVLFSNPDPAVIPRGLPADQWPVAASVPWFGMTVDPTDWNTMYLGGMSWLHRVHATEQPNAGVRTTWAQWDQGSGWDHRSLTFLGQRILLATGDPGVFGMYDPENVNVARRRPQWVSLNNSLSITELYSAAYDPTTGFLCGGAQDVGSPVQDGTGGWMQLPNGGGDGGQSQVGSDGVYYYHATGTFLRNRHGNVRTPAGLPEGTYLIAVSPADPMRMLIAAKSRLHESTSQGDTVADITPPTMTGHVTAFVYGVDNADAAYVGTSTGQLFVRSDAAGALGRAQAYPEGPQVDEIALDLNDWRRAAVISNDGKVLYTIDGGANFANIRANVGDVIQLMQTIELVRAGDRVVILVGGTPPAGHGGVVRAIIADSTDAKPNVVWTDFATDLPHASVSDLHYYPPVTLRDGTPAGDILLAGSFGRGAWTIPNAAGTIVPDCIGQTEPLASETLAAAALRVGAIRVLAPPPRTTSRTPLRVVDQLPEAGTRVVVGSLVNLTMQRQRPHQ